MYNINLIKQLSKLQQQQKEIQINKLQQRQQEIQINKLRQEIERLEGVFLEISNEKNEIFKKIQNDEQNNRYEFKVAANSQLSQLDGKNKILNEAISNKKNELKQLKTEQKQFIEEQKKIQPQTITRTQNLLTTPNTTRQTSPKVTRQTSPKVTVSPQMILHKNQRPEEKLNQPKQQQIIIPMQPFKPVWQEPAEQQAIMSANMLKTTHYNNQIKQTVVSPVAISSNIKKALMPKTEPKKESTITIIRYENMKRERQGDLKNSLANISIMINGKIVLHADKDCDKYIKNLQNFLSQYKDIKPDLIKKLYKNLTSQEIQEADKTFKSFGIKTEKYKINTNMLGATF